MKVSISLYILCLMLGCSTGVKGTTGDIRFRNIDIEKGLSNNQVQSIFKDSRGFIWIGTMSGLNRFDGNNLTLFKNDPNDSSSLADNFVRKIVEDPNGILWILSTNSSLCFYDPSKDAFSSDLAVLHKNIAIPRNYISDIYMDKNDQVWITNDFFGIYMYSYQADSVVWLKNDPNDLLTISLNNVTSIEQNSEGDYWVVNGHGVVEKLEQDSLNVIARVNVSFNNDFSPGENFRIFIDRDDDLWIYTISGSLGVVHYGINSNKQIKYEKESKKYTLTNNITKGIIQDDEGYIWIGTDHGGLDIIDKTNGSMINISHDPGEMNSLPDNSISALYKDNSGIVWIGMYKGGLAYYHPEFFKFGLVRNNPLNSNSLCNNDINCFAEDDEGNIWIGTNGDGLIQFNSKLNKFKCIRNEPDNSGSLSNDIIVSLLNDSKNRLWIGTYFGGLDYYDGTTFQHYRHDSDNPKSIADDKVWQIFESSKGEIWIGTLGGGVDIFDPEKGTFKHIREKGALSDNSRFILSIEEDNTGQMWFGTARGVDVYNPQTKKITKYLNEPGNKHSLSHNRVLAIKRDNRGWCWLGTSNGLCLFDEQNKSFVVFRKDQGLVDNSVVGIEVDDAGNLWIITSNGLSNLILKDVKSVQSFNYSFRNYTKSDGLQGSEFNERAIFKTQKGEILVGGVHGYNVFKPSDIKSTNQRKSIVLLKFELFNQTVKPHQVIGKRIILNQSLLMSDEITLRHNENIFSIEFAAIDFFNPRRLIYQYRMDGFNDNWLTLAPGVRKTTFTNLNPGSYNFRVRASEDGFEWNTEEAKLRITILPTFWATKWAKLIYFVLFLLVLFGLRYLILRRERLKHKIDNERKEMQRRQELDNMKIKFITNVSHEFRTPLTLILAHAERLRQAAKEQWQKKQVDMIGRNGKRLLSLVNQLLDFRKMEVNQLTLNTSYGDIIRFLKDTVVSFSDLFEHKKIDLIVNSEVGTYSTWFDHDKIEKVIFNLLSNAFKFTHEEGSVLVEISLQKIKNPSVKEEKFRDWLIVKITDSGIGISTSKINRVFDRFFQEEKTGEIANQGTGIGMALSKEFILLHGGTISVESELDRGSSFIIKLPLEISHSVISTEEVKSEIVKTQRNKRVSETENDQVIRGERQSILLVEDNEDLRFYLKENLQEKYQILEAPNGEIAWEIILDNMPDFVVSDVMMPIMDGIELCSKIKNDTRTSHLPVILLTARTSENQKVEGLESGADDYMTKPFSHEILELKIRNRLKSRENLRSLFGHTFKIEPAAICVTSLDEKFFQKALDTVDHNMANESFTVEQLGQELGISRTHLYKKLLAITGKTPIEFIRIIRLKRAAQLLKESQLTVNEIAYQVGYNGARYFSKHFKEEFNMTPSRYMKSDKV